MRRHSSHSDKKPPMLLLSMNHKYEQLTCRCVQRLSKCCRPLSHLLFIQNPNASEQFTPVISLVFSCWAPLGAITKRPLVCLKAEALGLEILRIGAKKKAIQKSKKRGMLMLSSFIPHSEGGPGSVPQADVNRKFTVSGGRVPGLSFGNSTRTFVVLVYLEHLLY